MSNVTPFDIENAEAMLHVSTESAIKMADLNQQRCKNSEDVESMIRAKVALDGSFMSRMVTTEDDPKNFGRYVRSVAFCKILKDVNAYLFLHCNHNYVEDLIDINPDKSKTIYYCDKCYLEHCQ